jgi:hypothetical protein
MVYAQHPSQIGHTKFPCEFCNGVPQVGHLSRLFVFRGCVDFGLIEQVNPWNSCSLLFSSLSFNNYSSDSCSSIGISSLVTDHAVLQFVHIAHNEVTVIIFSHLHQGHFTILHSVSIVIVTPIVCPFNTKL